MCLRAGTVVGGMTALSKRGGTCWNTPKLLAVEVGLDTVDDTVRECTWDPREAAYPRIGEWYLDATHVPQGENSSEQ